MSEHQPDQQVVGRYAPSPSGVQHLGNLRTALIAWLHARLQGGQFLVRMEDLDTPRTVAGSADQILHDLEWLGLDWDGEVVYQSARTALYESALDELDGRDLLYPCYCSRKDIAAASSAPHHSQGVYPGTCAGLSTAQEYPSQQTKQPASQPANQHTSQRTEAAAIRLRVSPSLKANCGDFVVKRADQLFAYQLAVVVDDLEQGVTEVVRGQDLASSAARQQYLASLFAPGRTPIHYLHAPLMLDQDGNRLAKRDGSNSLANLQVEGQTAEQIIATLAQGLGLLDHQQALSAEQLLKETDLARVNRVLGEF